MKLQVALDGLDRAEALRLAKAVAPFVDVIEAGTPLIKSEGIGIVRMLRDGFPDHEIVADLKTMDTGAYEADLGFAAGADIVTVLGVADPDTVAGAVESAQRHGGRVLVDLINVADPRTVARAASRSGVDMVGVHSGIDQQLRGISPLATVREIAGDDQITAGLCVAGGLNPDTIRGLHGLPIDVVVVGGAITNAADPAAAAAACRAAM